ncbi:MAG: tRNA (adenosine(37)-N6)-dimethylallyltransferase MiaA [Bacteroidetes bacterium]|nr:tRNA (adenosine(37)-N6)-dimethylallyltransferase MiaA [Bacteroidota bacterium]
MERSVIIITGPTCSGKTALSLKVANILKSEIISADSRQIFKYLNIGTAKPSEEELKKNKHYFIDHLKPDEYYNASIFENEALKICNNLFSQNRIPIIVGGSGLYIKALVDGIFDSEKTDFKYREFLLSERKTKGNEHLHNMLNSVDPVSASKMLPQNWKRVMRCLEVYHSTGSFIWEEHNKQNRKENISFHQFALDVQRKKLYSDIETRVDLMINSGLIEEVKSILEMGYNRDINSLNTVGYKEIISFLFSEVTLERAVELIKRNTRRYAKRQLTWFRGDNRIKWISKGDSANLDFIAEEIISDTTSI